MTRGPRRLAELRVRLERVSEGERAVELGYPDDLGLRTKLGGDPDWVQDEDTPVCDCCGQPMSFVAQIDSIEHQNRLNPLSRPALGEKDYMFGDVGMLYVFYCFDCGNPTCFEQSF